MSASCKLQLPAVVGCFIASCCCCPVQLLLCCGLMSGCNTIAASHCCLPLCGSWHTDRSSCNLWIMAVAIELSSNVSRSHFSLWHIILSGIEQLASPHFDMQKRPAASRA
eukprot:3056419-Alexandrium_andersonii.AAC.1